ncbi:MAG: hypothetical protein H0V07_11805 [Propionibacteriales bacterium]|nr:hypothetical protein [Propionibacteriales bacterium]
MTPNKPTAPPVSLASAGRARTRPGDFFSVPANAVQGESNPGEKRTHAVPIADPTTDAKGPVQR